MGDQGEGVPITVFNSERSFRVSQGREHCRAGEEPAATGSRRPKISDSTRKNFLTVLTQKEEEAGEESKHRYRPGGKGPLSGLPSGVTAQTVAGGPLHARLRHPKRGSDPGPVPPSRGRGRGY